MPIKQKFITAHGGTMNIAVATLNRTVTRLKVWRVVSFSTTNYATRNYSQATITALCERKVAPVKKAARGPREGWLEPLGSHRRRA